jgi:hypothetical protein
MRSNGAAPPKGRGTVDSCLQLMIRPVGRAHRAAVLSAELRRRCVRGYRPWPGHG